MTDPTLSPSPAASTTLSAFIHSFHSAFVKLIQWVSLKILPVHHRYYPWACVYGCLPVSMMYMFIM